MSPHISGHVTTQTMSGGETRSMTNMAAGIMVNGGDGLRVVYVKYTRADPSMQVIGPMLMEPHAQLQ